MRSSLPLSSAPVIFREAMKLKMSSIEDVIMFSLGNASKNMNFKGLIKLLCDMFGENEKLIKRKIVNVI